MEDYTLQKCGVTSYIAGRNELIIFRDIRRYYLSMSIAIVTLYCWCVGSHYTLNK